MTATAEDFVLPREAAGPLRVSEETVRRLCRTGDIDAIKVGKGWRIYAAWLASVTSWQPEGADAT